jgi:hypothetical protein
MKKTSSGEGELVRVFKRKQFPQPFGYENKYPLKPCHLLQGVKNEKKYFINKRAR